MARNAEFMVNQFNCAGYLTTAIKQLSECGCEAFDWIDWFFFDGVKDNFGYIDYTNIILFQWKWIILTHILFCKLN